MHEVKISVVYSGLNHVRSSRYFLFLCFVWFTQVKKFKILRLIWITGDFYLKRKHVFCVYYDR